VATAGVSSALAGSTVNLVNLFTASELAMSASTVRVLALTERVVRTMFLSKLKIAIGVLLVATAMGLGAGRLYSLTQDAQPPAKQQPQAATAQAPANPVAQGKSPAPGKEKGTIVRAPDSYTLAVALAPDGTVLARGGHDATVDLWEVASGKKLHTLRGHTVPILRLAFSPDGKTLASITGTWLPDDVRGEVKLWDVATGKERVSIQGHPNRMLALAFSADGKTLATSSRTVKLWEVETGKEKRELEFGKGILPWSLAFSPDGKTLATGTGGGIMEGSPGPVILWDLTTWKERATFTGHPGIITWIGITPDGKTLASASGSSGIDKQEDRIRLRKPLAGQIKLWDLATKKELATLPLRLPWPLQFFDLTFAADGKTLVSATASFGNNEKEGGIAVQQWEVATGRLQKTSWATFDASGPPGAGTNAGVFFAALSADGKTVAWGGAEGLGSPFSSRRDQPIIGTAQVWHVRTLATWPAKKQAEPQPPPGQPDR
jgi:WD40 repeat protein